MRRKYHRKVKNEFGRVLGAFKLGLAYSAGIENENCVRIGKGVHHNFLSSQGRTIALAR